MSKNSAYQTFSLSFIFLISYLSQILSSTTLSCDAASMSLAYSTVPICQIVLSSIFLVIFSLELDKKIQVVNFVGTDSIRALIGAILYTITSVMIFVEGAEDGVLVASGVIILLLLAFCKYVFFSHIKKKKVHRVMGHILLLV
uniref:Uncharacterized protein n=1 Tax=Kryptolebias marmoratus TaxID=37003 RepID=A0A3Q2ZXH7_KRYMA